MKAIETKYKGCRFRSRLEARWAVFFDALGIQWLYEPEGFEIHDMRNDAKNAWRYLPDFYLPKTQTWVEVKGDVSNVADDYYIMLANAIDYGGCLPRVSNSAGSTRGLLWLGDIPSGDLGRIAVHPILQHAEGGWVNRATFDGEKIVVDNSQDEYFDALSSPARELRAGIGLVGGLDCGHAIPGVLSAYRAARSARFEFGESG